MEFGTREILIVLGILVLVAIVLDGLRRVKQARYGKLRTGKRKQPIFDDDGDDYGSELPSGPARVVQVRDPDSCEQLSQKIRQSSDLSQSRQTSVFRARVEQGVQPPVMPVSERSEAHFDQPHFDQPRPSPEPTAPHSAPAAQDAPKPAPFTALDDEPAPEPAPHQPEQRRPQDVRPEELSSEQPLPDQSLPERPRAETSRIEKPLVAEPDRPRPQPATTPAKEAQHRPEEARDHRQGMDSDEVLILHLMAHKGERLEGEALLQQLLDHKLRYGAMKIFHRHEGADGSGPVHFSLANSLNPGTFELSNIADFSTPGVTFIMPLGDLRRPIESFELLIDTATSMAKKLNGELKDETRSALTRQTIEHYKQRIIDFTRRSFTLTN